MRRMLEMILPILMLLIVMVSLSFAAFAPNGAFGGVVFAIIN